MMLVPIVVTLVGIVTDVSDVHDWKTPPPNSDKIVLVSMLIMLITVII